MSWTRVPLSMASRMRLRSGLGAHPYFGAPGAAQGFYRIARHQIASRLHLERHLRVQGFHRIGECERPFGRKRENVVGEPDVVRLKLCLQTDASPRRRTKAAAHGSCCRRLAWRTSCIDTGIRGWRPCSAKNSRALSARPAGIRSMSTRSQAGSGSASKSRARLAPSGSFEGPGHRDRQDHE